MAATLTVLPSFAHAQEHWTLPSELVEVSGLSVASENSVFAHNDEHAIVYEVNIETGSVPRAFALGDPTAKGDFEGIAAYGERIYLLTSAGWIYEAPIGEHRARVRYNAYDTGTNKICETEGLAVLPGGEDFLILCKRVFDDGPDEELLIFRWSLSERRAQTQAWLTIPYDSFMAPNERSAFRASGLEWDEKENALIVISSRSHTAYRFTATGALIGKNKLSSPRHIQTEGVTRMPSGDFVFADEGNARQDGFISVYSSLR